LHWFKVFANKALDYAYFMGQNVEEGHRDWKADHRAQIPNKTAQGNAIKGLLEGATNEVTYLKNVHTYLMSSDEGTFGKDFGAGDEMIRDLTKYKDPVGHMATIITGVKEIFRKAEPRLFEGLGNRQRDAKIIFLDKVRSEVSKELLALTLPRTARFERIDKTKETNEYALAALGELRKGGMSRCRLPPKQGDDYTTKWSTSLPDASSTKKPFEKGTFNKRNGNVLRSLKEKYGIRNLKSM
jgi:hypothetical protein